MNAIRRARGDQVRHAARHFAAVILPQVHQGKRREIYYFRDQQGLEVDFVAPAQGGTVRLIEAKAGRTVTPDMAAPMQRLAAAWMATHPRLPAPEMLIVYRSPKAGAPFAAVAPGVRAAVWKELARKPA
jgi:hypothetical protein